MTAEEIITRLRATADQTDKEAGDPLLLGIVSTSMRQRADGFRKSADLIESWHPCRDPYEHGPHGACPGGGFIA